MKKVTILLIGLGLLLVFSLELAAKGPPDGGGGGGGGAIPGHISMSVDGAVVADQDCDANLGADTTIHTCNKAGNGATHKISLGDFFMKVGNGPRIYPTGWSADDCFHGGPFDVTMQVMLNSNSSAETVLRFWAYKKDRVTKILYVLRLNDLDGWRMVDNSPGAFPPPTPGDWVFMGKPLDNVATYKTSWNLGTSKKNVAEDACVDSGTFPAGSNGEQFINVIFARDS